MAASSKERLMGNCKNLFNFSRSSYVKAAMLVTQGCLYAKMITAKCPLSAGKTLFLRPVQVSAPNKKGAWFVGEKSNRAP